VNRCVAAGPTPLLAVSTMTYDLPRVAEAGVPAMAAVPFLAVNFRPFGSAPCSVTAATGNPVVRTVNAPCVPALNVAWFAEEIAGGVPTVSRNRCV
jgi:hypothetical protein